ncbi:hypothetical protein F5888DRAFT_1644306 [Russula emetica]|nr:hypothetical protein F5888DRAFT_1644306 [Russula emetica]
MQPSLRVGFPASPTMDPPFPPNFMPKIFINGHELLDSESADDIDIYRGDRPSTPTHQSQESGSVTSIKSISDTSSGSSRLPGGRLGALTTRLERAITRWARRNWADSSSSIASSGSSDSSRSSFRTTNRSSRRRRPPSIADVVHREESERAVAARIRAREIGRIVPREFNLYAPPPFSSQNTGPIEEEQQVVRTFSLDVMLPHLNPLLRNSGKHRHAFYHTTTRPTANRVEIRRDSAWWLDVANPTWGDMKTLGRLLHLHPLTLEDILQQEPREKLESFPKLGYYFITFRAIDYTTPDERLEIVSQKTGSSELPIQGVANETCIYLVVFRDGICTFHFSNISEHLDRVRGKLKTTAQTARRSSAWIAHGILDSVVDSFFPLVEEIEEHVMAIESVVHNKDNPIPPANTRALRILPAEETIPSANPWALPAGEKVATATSFVDEKHGFSKDVASIKTAKTQFSLPGLTCGLIQAGFTRASFDLHRMARTRHLATSVTRVLTTKPEVVAGIRKRLLASDGPDASDEAEVAIYFGDVQDHILTLQQSLAHYERMLSESHPMYIQNLHFDLLSARAKGDFAMFVLALVSVMVVPPSVVVGAFSMNVQLPSNINDGELWLFGMVIAIILCIKVSFLGLVKYWWIHARRGVKLE